MLSSNVWRVKWSSGGVWESVRFERNQVFVSRAGNNYLFEFETNGRDIAEIWSTEKDLFYRATHQGDTLQIIKLASKNGAEVMTGVGTPHQGNQ